ncbi:hypothetical protein BGW36DRAFT_427865 [Talaromyces proteolyticus]|uniref:ABM domain-containing protein n=1 Tax=Talaromyces proteolyticus TaxID=1131652 RepID=A0AAD4KQA8_9EURO|nr:uncharacterized protein BGW36DRAFT_427865 [Talaromyces proteolyticus]KAH8697927.1 hypothetical protein BGW36DRAFT_427865 [Talaromyces proteolyticus]
MALCLAPTLKFKGRDQATQFLGLIRDIYQVTYKDEDECRAYCWFRKDDDPCTVQGFEFYENDNALTVIHRSSNPYKKMRKFLAALQSTGSKDAKFPPLILMTPVEGFVNNNNKSLHFESRSCKLTITKIEVCSDHGEAKSILTSLGSLARNLNSKVMGLACFVAVTEEKEGDQPNNHSAVDHSTTAHFLFVQCYSLESASPELFEMNTQYL